MGIKNNVLQINKQRNKAILEQAPNREVQEDNAVKKLKKMLQRKLLKFQKNLRSAWII